MNQEQAEALSIAFAKFTHDEGFEYHKSSYDPEKDGLNWVYDGQILHDSEVLRLFKESYSKSNDIYAFMDIINLSETKSKI